MTKQTKYIAVCLFFVLGLVTANAAWQDLAWKTKITPSYQETSASGPASLGQGKSTGFSVDGDITGTMDFWRTSFFGHYNYSELEGFGAVDDRWGIGNKTTHFFDDNWLIVNSLTYAQDTVKGVDTTMDILGYGYTGKIGESFEYTFVPGVAYISKDFASGTDTEDFAAGFQFDSSYAFNENVSLDETFLYADTFGDNYIWTGSLAVTAKMTEHVAMRVKYEVEYDTYITAPSEKDRRTLSAGMSLTF